MSVAVSRSKLLTPELTQRITDALGVGLTRRLSCMRAGIGETTFYAWYNQGMVDIDAHETSEGSKPLTLFAEFAMSVDAAESEVAELAASTIFTAATNDPQWASWILTRRFRKDYQEPTQAVQQSGSVRIEFVEVDTPANRNAEDKDTDDEPNRSPASAGGQQSSH